MFNFHQFQIPDLCYMYVCWSVDIICIMKFNYICKDLKNIYIKLFSDIGLFGSAEFVLCFLPSVLCLQLGFELD